MSYEINKIILGFCVLLMLYDVNTKLDTIVEKISDKQSEETNENYNK